MSEKWLYSHDGVTHGPFSMEEIKELATRAKLLESDMIWQAGSDPQSAILAQAALDFSELSTRQNPKPDWLADVAKMERKGPLPGPVGCKEPDWLEDLRLWYGLGAFHAAKSAPTHSQAALSKGISDLIERWTDPLGPTKPTKLSKQPDAKTQLQKNLKPDSAEDRLAEKAIQETGFDLKTGQVVDPHKFRKWQESQTNRESTATNQSLMETFRTARAAIASWLDDDSRVPLILANDPDAIKNDPSLAEIFRRYEGCGSVMQERLLHYLEFMLENRRKYYAARSSPLAADAR